jgi:hypothetical protein
VSDASGVASDQYSTYSTSGPTRHNLLGSGSAKICGGTLKLTATYNRLTNNTADSYEFLNLKQPQLSEYGYRYNLLTFQGDYSHKIPTWGKHAFGFYLGYTDNRMSLDNPTNAAAQNVNGDNKWAEAYYSLSVERDKLSINGGLRGRFERNSSNEDASEKKTLSYTTLAPKLSLGYSFARDYILTASYALFYDLPTFRQINPALRLSNLIFYSQGNPDLKPAYTNRFNVTANIRDFTVMAEYYDSHRNIFNVTEPYTDGTFIKYPANMRRTSDFLLSAEYTATPVRGLRLYGRVLGVCSNLRYLYNSKLVKTTDYSMEMDFNAAYRFRKFSTFVNGQYNSPQKVDTRRLSYRFSLNVGADCSLLNGKLYLRLEAQDIFRRSVTPSWDEYSPMLHQYRVNRYDTRGLSFTVRYKFTTAKTGFKQATAPVDANRLE